MSAHYETHVFSVIIIGIIYFSIRKQTENIKERNRYFLALLWLNLAILLVDASRGLLKGYQEELFRFGFYAANVVYYVLVSVIITFWLLYINHHIHEHKKHFRAVLGVGVTLITLTTILSIISPISGTLFTVDTQGMFVRGPLYMPVLISIYLCMFFSLVYVMVYKAIIPRTDFGSLMFFTLPPIIAGLVQVAYPNENFVWPAMTISLLIVFVFIQSKLTNTDPLTGVFNRREFENFSAYVTNLKSMKKMISAIMIDINDFKRINDEISHRMGDLALREVGDILKRSVRKHDFVSRIGGDEFCIILESDNEDILIDIVRRIHSNIDHYNQRKTISFPMTISMGYGIYDEKEYQTFEDFLEVVDRRMYQDKEKSKANNH